MSERYTIEETAERFLIRDVQDGLSVATVNKVDLMGGIVPAELLAGRVRDLFADAHAEQEQLAQDRQTLDAHLLALTPCELKTLAQGVRAGSRLFTDSQL